MSDLHVSDDDKRCHGCSKSNENVIANWGQFIAAPQPAPCRTEVSHSLELANLN